MTTADIFMMWGSLILGTQLCRFLPTYLPKKVLASAILQKLNRILPLVIMLLLLLSSLSLPKEGGDFSLLIAQIAALVLVVLSYQWLRNTLLSVALGIIGLNGFLWVMS